MMSSAETSLAELDFFGESIEPTLPPALPPAITAKMSERHNLATVGSISMKVGRVIDNPRSSAAQIEAILSQDVALTARLLRLANSTYYAARRPITTIRQAVARVGFQTLRGVVVASALRDQLPDTPEARFQWRHSTGVASIGRHLALQRRGLDPDLAFVAGLTHDIGRLFLMQAMPEAFARIEALVDTGLDRRVAEFDVLACDHSDIGARLALDWALPAPIVVAIRMHHRLGAMASTGLDRGHTPLVAVVRLADELFHANFGGERLAAEPTLPVGEASGLLALTEPDLQSYWPEIIASWEESERLLR